MADLDRLKRAVCHYCSRYHILQFEVSEAYDLHSQWQTDYFPHTEEKGCYAFFDEGMDLLYVGKASCNSSIGARAGTYLQWDKSDNCLKQTGSDHWDSRPFYLFTIPVHDAHQAPSLEEYLIETLDPPENRAGRVRQGGQVTEITKGAESAGNLGNTLPNP
ncbi:MAG: hypothetical protein P8J20_16065 [Novosphingobium sp.]|nr:hypothetical protein [Novosphingobium sp.]